MNMHEQGSELLILMGSQVRKKRAEHGLSIKELDVSFGYLFREE